MAEMVDAVMPKISVFKNFILKNYWPSYERISKLQCAILFISGTNDELVPHQHTHKLKENAKAAKFIDYFEVEGGDHNNTWRIAGPLYTFRINAFIERALTN